MYRSADSGHSHGEVGCCLLDTLDLSVTDFPSWFRQNSLCSQELQGLRVRHMPFPTLLFQGPLSCFPSLSSLVISGVSIRMLATVQRVAECCQTSLSHVDGSGCHPGGFPAFPVSQILVPPLGEVQNNRRFCKAPTEEELWFRRWGDMPVSCSCLLGVLRGL